MKTIKERRNDLAVTMFGRKFEYCNDGEQELVLKEMIDGKHCVLTTDEVFWNGREAVCSTVMCGRRLSKRYIFYSERAALLDFRRNPLT